MVAACLRCWADGEACGAAGGGKRGAYLGPVKGNQPALQQATELWLRERGCWGRAADVRQATKGHGRLEIRELWLEEASALGERLEAEYGWPGVRYYGRLRRWRCRLSGPPKPQGWQVQEVLWVAGGSIGPLSVQQALECLRGHWEIENRLYWVRDVSFCEGRLLGREVAPGLSTIRNLALNLIRALGYRFVVDAFRTLSARADRGLSLLTSPQP